ncbi:C-terminal novel E3 ligase, LRR-interacting [Pseudomonas antarctica]|uniref:RING-type E3 ubiquitin transferase n=2 Tax=Pseudomonas antarctica TaxID=219572 RepID=A0A1G9YZR3_9PSED|nr:putative E3 ubiquitin-protein ligase ipaH7.8 [Pseudomonas antarctica]SDN14031.1 C-terminal novel E3 ligase, LRR-interacting [Pseudomonas antarctica]
MRTQDDLNSKLSQLTQRQLQAALLEMTGDLDKAQVLQKKLPGWMISAPPGVLEALTRDAVQVADAQAAVAERLKPLQALDEFCSERLKDYCGTRWQVAVEPRKDLLIRAVDEYEKELLPLTYVKTVRLVQDSLLHVAMQNFSEDEVRAQHFPAGSLLQSGSVAREVIGITPLEFAQGCRSLDLGRLYQQHISEVLELDSDGTGDGAYVNDAATDIGRMKTLDMKIDAHIALMRGDLSPGSYGMLCTLLERQQTSAQAQAAGVLFQGRPVTWQGLNTQGACLWSILVFSGRSIAQYPQEPCVVYMPNEPERAFFEYASLDDFQVYLKQKLEVAAYRAFFNRYLSQGDRVGFFNRFDQARTLGALEANPITVSLARHFFETYTAKLQADARALAVPVAEVDEQVREQRLQAYLDAGLTVLNLAGFVVPELGLLMTAVAVGQILGELYEGIEDWRRGDKGEAFKQLAQVAENITSMVVFAAGMKVVGSAMKRTGLNLDSFFRQFEVVRPTDGNLRLWRPDISQYAHDQRVVDDEVAHASGVYKVGGHSYVKVNDYVHRVSFDAKLDQWRASHRVRQTAYRPQLLHNGEGRWRFAFEQPDDWEDQEYLFSRLKPTGPGSSLHPRKLVQIKAIMDKPSDWGVYQAQECLPFPARFRDLYERFRLDQSIRDLIWQSENGASPNVENSIVQMHALPLLQGWPQGRYFEVLDAQRSVKARYPVGATFNDIGLRVLVTDQMLSDGKVFDALLSELDASQKAGLLGEGVAADQEHAVLARQLLTQLRADRKPLFEQLYQAYDGPVPAEWALLRRTYPQLSRALMRELMAETSTVQRGSLRDNQRIPMALAENVQRALEEQRLDRALMGLEQPELAGLDTALVAIRSLPHVAGWGRALRLELREDSPQGDLLALGALNGADVRRVVVRSNAGFEAFDEHGVSSGGPYAGPDGLFEAIDSVLTNTQRVALELPLKEPSNIWRLRYMSASQAKGERELAAQAFSHKVSEPVEEAVPCEMADLPTGPLAHPRALVRKVKRLYPLFSDAQVSSLLMALGADPLSRAKAVKRLEAELGHLRALLKHWKSDTQGMEKQPGLSDIRDSRQQVAERIEACWRRQSVVLNEHQVSVTSLNLDGMRVGSLPTLPAEVRFDHVQQLSLKNMQLGDDVAYFLKCFKGLKRLELDRNRLTRLPEVLSRMFELDHLSMPRNRLALTEYTRVKLADLSALRLLDLSHNPLEKLVDISKMRDLHTLLLQDTKITDLPLGLERPAHLEQMDLRGNSITVLPEWLFTTPRSFSQSINLGGNPLSRSTVNALVRYRDDVGIGMGYVEDDQPRMTELKARALWLPDEVANRDLHKRTVWANLRDDPESTPLFQLLAQLSGTADSRYVHEDLTRRVWEVLQATHDSVELRERVFQLAAHPANCSDGTAEMFSQIEVLKEIEKAMLQAGRTQGNSGALLTLSRGLFRLSELEKIAATYAVENFCADPLEVSLAFRVGLAQVLQLPGQPKHMNFALFADVTSDGLEVAHSQVRTAELSPAFLRFITQLAFWRTHLKQQFPGAFQSATVPFDTQQQRLFENSQNLTDGEYLEQMEALRSPRRQAITEVVERLTQQMLKHQDLGICHVPGN